MLDGERLQDHGVDDRERDGSQGDSGSEDEDDEQRVGGSGANRASRVAQDQAGRAEQPRRGGEHLQPDCPNDLQIGPQRGMTRPATGVAALGEVFEHVANRGVRRVARRHHSQEPRERTDRDGHDSLHLLFSTNSSPEVSVSMRSSESRVA